MSLIKKAYKIQMAKRNNRIDRFHLQLMQKFLSREELAEWVASRNGKKKEAQAVE